jgi:hypothetical protein
MREFAMRVFPLRKPDVDVSLGPTHRRRHDTGGGTGENPTTSVTIRPVRATAIVVARPAAMTRLASSSSPSPCSASPTTTRRSAARGRRTTAPGIARWREPDGFTIDITGLGADRDDVLARRSRDLDPAEWKRVVSSTENCPLPIP